MKINLFADNLLLINISDSTFVFYYLMDEKDKFYYSRKCSYDSVRGWVKHVKNNAIKKLDRD